MPEGRTLHGPRRTVATELIRADVPELTVAQLLGHSGVETMRGKRYSNGLLAAALRDALNLVWAVR